MKIMKSKCGFCAGPNHLFTQQYSECRNARLEEGHSAMRRHSAWACAVFALLVTPIISLASPDWSGDLIPITREDWNAERAAHLLERAGFGATPAEISRFAAMTPEAAVRHLVYHKKIANDLPVFDDSGAHDSGLEPFPASRPAATDLAKETGESMGIKVKPTGNRRLQPVANKFFYWL